MLHPLLGFLSKVSSPDRTPFLKAVVESRIKAYALDVKYGAVLPCVNLPKDAVTEDVRLRHTLASLIRRAKALNRMLTASLH